VAQFNKQRSVKAAFALVAAFSASTAVWAAWAYSTRGDYFANGSSLLIPTELLGFVLGAGLGWRAEGNKMGMCILIIGVFAMAYVVLLPDGWWAQAPPRSH